MANKKTSSANTLNRNRYITFHLVNLANTLSRSASRLYLNLFGVGVIEWRILSILAIESNVTAGHVCQSIDLDAAAASRSIKTLEKHEFITLTKDDRDSRKRLIVLTEKGRELHDKILKIAMKRHEILIKNMTKTQVDELLSMLNHLDENLQSVLAYDAELVSKHAE